VSRSPRWRRLLGGEQLPDGFAGRLDEQERVVAVAEMVGGGHLVVTSHGVWLPDGRRIGWHLVSKATWSDGALTVVEAEEFDSAGEVVLLRDLPPLRLRLAEPGRVPEAVHKRVTSSIRYRHHRELPGGGAWFVQRSVPGRDGLLLQVRADPGTDPAAVRRVATEVAGQLRQARDTL
jgi:hypothetical protein